METVEQHNVEAEVLPSVLELLATDVARTGANMSNMSTQPAGDADDQ